MDPFEFALDQGFDAFEWFSDEQERPEGGSRGWSSALLDSTARLRIRQLGETRGIRYSVHAPWRATPLTQEGCEELRASLDFAQEIGARVMNLHLTGPESPEDFAEALAPTLRAASRLGVGVSLENTPETSPEQFRAFFSALTRRGLRSSQVGLCFDFGHTLLCQETGGSPIRFLQELRGEIPVLHCHLHENCGDRDSHMTLFTGPLGQDPNPLRQVLEALAQADYAGSMILEQWPEPRDQLIQARNRLRELWPQRVF
jgi:sugar phosphate isomerase/epimerase